MSDSLKAFLKEHSQLSRRYFLRCGVTGAAAFTALNQLQAQVQKQDPVLQNAIDQLETNLTVPKDFRDVSRGNPKPLAERRKRKAVSLTRCTVARSHQRSQKQSTARQSTHQGKRKRPRFQSVTQIR